MIYEGFCTICSTVYRRLGGRVLAASTQQLLVNIMKRLSVFILCLRADHSTTLCYCWWSCDWKKCMCVQQNIQPDAQSILYLLLCRVDTAQHVSGTIVPIIRNPHQLPLQPLVTVWLPVWTCFKLWSVNGPQLETRPARQSYGNQRLQRHLEGASYDGHDSARNMLSGIYATKQ
jgi:hypothetical protein